MENEYNISGASKQKLPQAERAQNKTASGPLSDRRVQIGIIAVAFIIVLFSVLFTTGAVKGPAEKPSWVTTHTREKNKSDDSAVPDQAQGAGAGQVPERSSRNFGD